MPRSLACFSNFRAHPLLYIYIIVIYFVSLSFIFACHGTEAAAEAADNWPATYTYVGTYIDGDRREGGPEGSNCMLLLLSSSDYGRRLSHLARGPASDQPHTERDTLQLYYYVNLLDSGLPRACTHGIYTNTNSRLACLEQGNESFFDRGRKR